MKRMLICEERDRKKRLKLASCDVDLFSSRNFLGGADV
jgi:hypothetical protein